MPHGPTTPAWRRRGTTALLVVGGILGAVGGRFAFEAVVNGIGTKVSQSGKPAKVGEPSLYEGPTFSAKLRGPVEVKQAKENGLQVTSYGSDQGDVYIAVAVMDLPVAGAYDFAAGADGIRHNIGGRIASDTPVDVAGRPAHDLMYTGVKDGQATAWTRLIVDDGRVYQILAVSLGKHTEPPADYTAALDTFVIRVRS